MWRFAGKVKRQLLWISASRNDYLTHIFPFKSMSAWRACTLSGWRKPSGNIDILFVFIFFYSHFLSLYNIMLLKGMSKMQTASRLRFRRVDYNRESFRHQVWGALRSGWQECSSLLYNKVKVVFWFVGNHLAIVTLSLNAGKDPLRRTGDTLTAMRGRKHPSKTPHWSSGNSVGGWMASAKRQTAICPFIVLNREILSMIYPGFNKKVLPLDVWCHGLILLLDSHLYELLSLCSQWCGVGRWFGPAQCRPLRCIQHVPGAHGEEPEPSWVSGHDGPLRDSH